MTFGHKPTVLIVPGLGNSPNDHWQTAWERERTDCVRANLGDWDNPTPAQWIERLDTAIKTLPGFVVIAAHSLGCILTSLWARASASHTRVAGALLVAPCDAEALEAPAPLRRFAPIPRSPPPFPTTVVASADDAFAGLARSREFAANWGSTFVNVGRVGHINAQSNLGGWQRGQELLNGLLLSRQE